MSRLRGRDPPQGIQGGLEHQLRYLICFFRNMELMAVGDLTEHITATPIQVTITSTIEAIGVVLENPVVGSIRMGIYEDNGDDPRGGALLVQGEMVALANRKNEIVVAIQLDPGLYWLAYHPEGDNDHPVPNLRQQTGGTLITYTHDLGAYGALPDPFPVAATPQTEVPPIYLMVSSVP